MVNKSNRKNILEQLIFYILLIKLILYMILNIKKNHIKKIFRIQKNRRKFKKKMTKINKIKIRFKNI